ncbi:HD domain-containing protein [Billgrantia sp. C5P2]|uniref:HD domain-containing protein n=1 Tax=Billgrantia sp. C5P2 TaxID=3436239 RepID=UPI003DA54492
MLSNFNLPNKLAERLNNEHGLAGPVYIALKTARPWFYDNKLAFFPGYTDHGLDHVNQVLSSAEALISDEAWAHVTPQDCALLVYAALLHDCAMHLSPDGFASLLKEGGQQPRSTFTSEDPPWSVLWNDFLTSALRMDSRRLQSIFGSIEPPRKPPLSALEQTDRDRLLIGEFLRRHHARLAHEIAIAGVPGPDGRSLMFEMPSPQFADLAGFVARSHNLSLRTAVDMLPNPRRRVYNNAHVPFVMALLRVADYVQIQASRAPGEVLEIRSLESPVSRAEWNKHHAVSDVHRAHDDPEALYVEVEPSNVRAFIGVKDLLQDIQSELDATWAVLGEVYGQHKDLRDLGLAIRRIRSNIEIPEKYATESSISYIPKKLRFRASDVEMLNLMVAPLYGDWPAVGIRELIQNAVDACRERADAERMLGLESHVDKREADVIVRLDEKNGQGWLHVEDKGVGMSLEIVENYFLKIGSSFRSSDIWKAKHTDDQGRSRVLRTGRFGVGVLAAFLLGDEVTVTTRHMHASDEEGLEFKCRLEDDLIEVRRVKAKVGTLVKVAIRDPKVLKKLCSIPEGNEHGYRSEEWEWDWFWQGWPRVESFLPGDAQPLDRPPAVPDPLEALPEGWFRISAPGYEDVIWTYEHLQRGRCWSRYWISGPNIICNGIEIKGGRRVYGPAYPAELEIAHSPSICVDKPRLIIYDPQGLFPLNLQRSSLVRVPDFHDLLVGSVALHYARALKNKSEDLLFPDKESLAEMCSFRLEGKHDKDRESHSVCIRTKKGWVPFDTGILLEDLNGEIIVLDPADTASDRGLWRCPSLRVFERNYLVTDGVRLSKVGRGFWLSSILGLFSEESESRRSLWQLPAEGGVLFIREKDRQDLSMRGQIPKYLWNNMDVLWTKGGWSLLVGGKEVEIDEDWSSLSKEMDRSGCFGVAFVRLANALDESYDLSPFAQAWRSLEVG